MKKIFSYLAVVTMLFIGGCSIINSSNHMNIVYNDEFSDDISYKMKNAVDKVNNFSFSGKVIIEKEQYQFSGKVIVGDSISNSVVIIKLGDIEIYSKDEKVYISYFYNGTNIIVKDKLDVFLDELVLILNKKGINCNIDIVKEIVDRKWIDEIDFSKIKDIDFVNDGYVFGNNNYKVTLSSDCLPKGIIINNELISLSIKFNYGKVSINIPIGYDIFPFSIGQVKHILKIDSLGDLIK